MSWGYGTSMCNAARIQPLLNYDEAHEHFNAVTPIRGRVQECRPLGTNRRYTWYTIERNDNCTLEDGNPIGRFERTYSCNISTRKIVEYFSNGDIVLHTNYWRGPTLFGFLTYTLRPIGTIKSCKGKWYFVNGDDQSFIFDKTLTLSRNDKGQYIPKDYVPEKKYSINRKVMNALRTRYSYFIDYGKTSLALSNELSKVLDGKQLTKLNFSETQLSSNDYRSERAGNNRKSLMDVLHEYERTQDLELLYEAMFYVSMSAGRWVWNRDVVICAPQQFVDKMDEVLKYENRDTVFIEIEQPIGTMFMDKNKRYFNAV
jgi:hypothetical protein